MRDPIRVSVTELSEWQECPQRWRYARVLGLRRKPGDTASPLISGSAIHAGIEGGLLLGKDRAMEAANSYLAQYGPAAEKYVAGASRALGCVPEHLWSIHNPQAETPLSVVYQPTADIRVEMRGRPDCWYYKDDVGLVIWEFKSTSSDEVSRLEQYTLWNMQPRYYAVLLLDTLAKDLPVYTAHAVLSTRGKGAVGEPTLLPKSQIKHARSHMLDIAVRVASARIDPTLVVPHYGFHCNWCEFAPIDEGVLTGADTQGIIAEEYERR